MRMRWRQRAVTTGLPTSLVYSRFSESIHTRMGQSVDIAVGRWGELGDEEKRLKKAPQRGRQSGCLWVQIGLAGAIQGWVSVVYWSEY
jgi:hypothetical protein